MKLTTPLPEKQYKNAYGSHNSTLDVSKTFDVLVDNVKELRERVEGKQETFDQRTARQLDSFFMQTITPSLKETLLRNLYSKVYYTEDKSYSVKWADVEAIINKLLP